MSGLASVKQEDCFSTRHRVSTRVVNSGPVSFGMAEITTLFGYIA